MKIFPFIKKSKWKLPFASNVQLAIFDNISSNISFSDTITDQTGNVKLSNISFYSDNWNKIEKGTYSMGYNWDASFRVNGSGQLDYEDSHSGDSGHTQVTYIGFNDSNIIIEYTSGKLATFNATNNSGVTYTIQ